MECGAVPETVPGPVPGTVPLGTLAISRTETGCQRSASSAASTCIWVSPQPVAGSRGISFWPFALISTTCGASTAMAGHTVPGGRVAVGRRRALTSPSRPESARCSVAVIHIPLPGIVCAPFTHRSTLTGTNDAGRGPLATPAGQPTQAGSPGTTRPPLTVGTGVAGADGPAGAVACPGAPVLEPGAPAPGAAPACTLPHPVTSAPAASAPATSSAPATALVRRPAEESS